MTQSEAEKVLSILCRADDGNEVVMLEVLNLFVAAFPEWASLARSRWMSETGKEWKVR